MKNFSVLGFFFLCFGVVALMPELAFAECEDDTLGGVICNVVGSSRGLPALATGLSYLMGLILTISAIWKTKVHVESPNQVEIWDPMKRFFTGGAFFALPAVLNAAVKTVNKGLSEHTESGFAGESSGQGLDAMMVALMDSVWEPMGMLLGAFGYLAGIIFIVIGISRFLKSEQEGAKGPTGIGTVMTFLVGGALISANQIMAAFSTSMFGTEVVTTVADLQYDVGLQGAEQHVLAVISAVIAFVALLGWVSFLRGFFIMRSVAEGNSQASVMAGMTHLLGGALAVNLGPALNAVQYTLGITDYGILFG